MQELYHAMTDDPTSGYRVLGYFEDFPSDRYPQDVLYLGQPNEVTDFLEKHAGEVDQLYCSLPLYEVRRLSLSLITVKIIWSVSLVFQMSVII